MNLKIVIIYLKTRRNFLKFYFDNPFTSKSTPLSVILLLLHILMNRNYNMSVFDNFYIFNFSS